MTPRSQALAFRIWAYANPRGWDCSVPEIAEAIGEPTQRVNRVALLKGWNNRLRHDTPSWDGPSPWNALAFSESFSKEPYRSEIVQRLRREAGL